MEISPTARLPGAPPPAPRDRVYFRKLNVLPRSASIRRLGYGAIVLDRKRRLGLVHRGRHTMRL